MIYESEVTTNTIYEEYSREDEGEFKSRHTHKLIFQAHIPY